MAEIKPASRVAYDDWENVGKNLQNIGKAWQWWIGDWLNYGEAKYGEKYSQAVEDTGVEPRTLEDCVYVAANVKPTERSVNLTWSHHRQVAKLQPREQKRWLKKAEKESLSVRELKTELRAVRIKKERSETPPLPSGEFDLILSDPPWRYDFAETDSRKIENHYPTMSLEELCELDLPAADN